MRCASAAWNTSRCAAWTSIPSSRWASPQRRSASWTSFCCTACSRTARPTRREIAALARNQERCRDARPRAGTARSSTAATRRSRRVGRRNCSTSSIRSQRHWIRCTVATNTAMPCARRARRWQSHASCPRTGAHGVAARSGSVFVQFTCERSEATKYALLDLPWSERTPLVFERSARRRCGSSTRSRLPPTRRSRRFGSNTFHQTSCRAAAAIGSLARKGPDHRDARKINSEEGSSCGQSYIRGDF